MKIPNGLISFMDTHFEISKAIGDDLRRTVYSKLIHDTLQAEGYCGLYSLTISLTEEFETLNKGREWDGEFRDTVDEFLKEKLV